MTLLELPTELILLIVRALSESDLAHLLQVHSSLYNRLFPHLYQHHLQKSHKGFFWSIATSNEAAVRHFLHYGANVNASINYTSICQAKIPLVPWFYVQRPLNVAAHKGNNALVDLLISHGACVHGAPPKAGWRTAPPAVVDAVLSGHDSTVRLLLMKGSPIAGPNMENGGLVVLAILRGQLSLLELLAEFKADFNILYQRRYPLNRAAISSEISTDIVRFLLDHGADINLANSGDGTEGLSVEAIRFGTIDTLRLLLERGATCPPPHVLQRLVEMATVETVAVLLQHGCTPDIEVLMAVVRAHHHDILQLFIDSGHVDLNTRGRTGSTLLHVAVRYCTHYNPSAKRPKTASPRPAGPPRRDVGGKMLRPIELVPQQVSAKCSVFKKPAERDSPVDIARSLIRAGADLNVTNAEGRTPLDLIRECPLAVQQILLGSAGR